MSVMQRKLFSSKEARTKLRDMGGIMSSFPELSGEVQRFQDGMMVEAPPVINYQQWSMMTPSARAAAGLPRSELEARNYFPDAPGPTAEDVSLGLGVDQELAEPGTSGGLFMSDLLDFVFGEAAMSRVRRPEPEAQDEEQRVAAPEGGTEETEDSGMTRGTPLYDQPEYQRIVDLMPPPPEEGDETADRDTLRDRAEARIELFRDLLGEDEPTARDRAMQFAMIGLAVAAGQSPNALTNIANGLLAGTQSMTEQEAARRGRDRELRASAVNSVFEELASQREIEASRVEEMRTGWQNQYDLAVQDAEALGIPAEDGDPTNRHAFAVNAANLWMQSRYPDLFATEGQEPIGDAPANAVRVSSRAEIEELEPGTQFVWTDGNVYTRS